MKVAVLFSGGKDSTFAVYEALRRGWEVKALIAVKPNSPEAYIWHYPTVELTAFSAEAMGIPVTLLKTDEIGPEKEVRVLEKVLSELEIDAILLGGVGLQKTQIESVKKIAEKYGVQVIVPHEGLSSEELLRKEVDAGFEILITDVASDGLGKEWLGKKITKENVEEFIQLSKKYGFDPLGEGGYYNTFVVDGPIFKKRVEIKNFEKVWDEKTYSGYIVPTEVELVEK